MLVRLQFFNCSTKDGGFYAPDITTKQKSFSRPASAVRKIAKAVLVQHDLN